MKLDDAVRHDSELRDDIAARLTAERDLTIANLERCDAQNLDELRSLKAYLDALRKLRFLLLKGDQPNASSHRRHA